MYSIIGLVRFCYYVSPDVVKRSVLMLSFETAKNYDLASGKKLKVLIRDILILYTVDVDRSA